MLVIHPNDRTTVSLQGLYAGISKVTVANQQQTDKEIKHLLNHVETGEIIMLLGHGSDKGLFTREDDTKAGFNRLIVNHSHAYYLRRHCILGIWCHANLFAEAEHLHGLFTGMFISELDEAVAYGVKTTPAELNLELSKFVKRLRDLLNERIPLHNIPEMLRDLDNAHTQLTVFNYRSVYYL